MLNLYIIVNDIEIQNRFMDLLCKTKHEHIFPYNKILITDSEEYFFPYYFISKQHRSIKFM